MNNHKNTKIVNVNSIIQEILIGDSIKKNIIPPNSVLLKINNFYKNDKVAKLQEVKRKKTFSRNSISNLIFKKISFLPRNIFFDYKISNSNTIDKQKIIPNIERKTTLLPPINDYVPNLSPERRINLLIDYLKKEKSYEKKYHSVTPKAEFKGAFNNKGKHIKNNKTVKIVKNNRDVILEL